MIDSKIPQVPMVAKLRTGRSVIVDYMSDRQLTETYCMIQEAAQYGEGYGIDEFGSEAEFRMDIKNSDCFAITCKESGCLLASFIIAVSKFYRGHSAMADPFVIVKRSERQQSLDKLKLSISSCFHIHLTSVQFTCDSFVERSLFSSCSMS
jgi:hypothetical protein